MQILDNKKDYYDWHQFEFGQPDKAATYDRRKSRIITEETLLDYCLAENTYEYALRRWDWNINWTGDWRDKNREKFGKILFEIGNVQYIIDVSRKWQKIDRIFKENKKITKNTVTFTHFRTGIDLSKRRMLSFDKLENIIVSEKAYNHNFGDCIWGETFIPSLIDSREFYNILANYFSGMYNDKTVEIVNSDVQKIENHGFDKKTSFRPNIKS